MIPEGCLGVVIECGYVPPTREAIDAHNRFEIPARLQAVTDVPAHATFKFDIIAALKKAISKKVVVRGIQSAADALKAVKAGADGIWLTASTFESDPSPISILKHVKSSVPSTTIMLSGGIRRGTDVLKAIALGADAVFLDYEAPLWGLHLDG